MIRNIKEILDLIRPKHDLDPRFLIFLKVTHMSSYLTNKEQITTIKKKMDSEFRYKLTLLRYYIAIK